MKSYHPILLSVFSVALFSIPFFSWGTGLLLLIAFVPILLIEDYYASMKREARLIGEKRKGSGFWYVMLIMSHFVFATTFWVYWATWIGIVASVILHTFYMTLVFWLFHWTKQRLGERLGYASLVIFWLTFEFLYLRAQVNFPWLILGNGFANDIVLIQWYEVTGSLGGSLWVLVMNIAIFKALKAWLESRRESSRPSAREIFKLPVVRKRLSWVVALFIFPALFSLMRYLTYEEDDAPFEFVVLQPNIDPYLKFTEMTQAEQTSHLLHLADSLVTDNTDYIIGPETFINNSVWISTIDSHPEFIMLRDFLENYPKAKLIMGATTYMLYTDPSEFTKTSKPLREAEYRYDHFNSAFQLDSTADIPFYHKSMLVVGVERMPYPRLLSSLDNLIIKLGGTTRGNGTQEFREAFPSPQDGTRVGPIICWESVFGEFVTGYVKEANADFLAIITNDGWWRNTPGHRQHNAFARLRAIECRRSIARSANTGISSLINQRGEELARIGWWERSGIVGELNKNTHLTFYVRHGDYLGWIATILTVIMLNLSIIIWIRRISRKS